MFFFLYFPRLAELYFWHRPYEHTADYQSISYGKVNDLVGYYGPPSSPFTMYYLFRINHNYLLLFGLFVLVLFLILTKFLYSESRPSIYEMLYDITAQYLGIRNFTSFTNFSSKIVLATSFFVAYIIWSVNCATMFSLLTSARSETFETYGELNESSRDIYITKRTQDLYSYVPQLFRCRRKVPAKIELNLDIFN